ncbi:MAG: C1 family peptidase [bacterium]
MKRGLTTIPLTLVLLCLLLGAGTVIAGAGDQPIYRPAKQYPVLEEIEAERAAAAAVRDSLQGLVETRYAEEADRKEETELELRLDWSDIKVPESPQVFRANWHFPPIPQYYTGTCWAFCSTSFLESEIQRLSGREIKLSEMWTVYWEYVEKARRFLSECGHSPLEEGSQDHGTLEVYKLYGAVPATAYRGVCDEAGRHDHTPLRQELHSYLQWVLNNKYWAEEVALANVRQILNRHLGAPPETFVYAGRQHTPLTFRDEVVQLDLDDYVSVVSTLRYPFGQYVLLDVPDNWRRKDDYLNLPLDTFYSLAREAVKDGYPVTFGGDVSEPGLDGHQDAAVIPSWDIPGKYIDQGSREFRLDNGTTSDDHGTHLVGYKRHQGRDWFLVKDSNRSSRLGSFKGYYFYEGDYLKLKMLAFMVHVDRLREYLP